METKRIDTSGFITTYLAGVIAELIGRGLVSATGGTKLLNDRFLREIGSTLHLHIDMSSENLFDSTLVSTRSGTSHGGYGLGTILHENELRSARHSVATIIHTNHLKAPPNYIATKTSRKLRHAAGSLRLELKNKRE